MNPTPTSPTPISTAPTSTVNPEMKKLGRANGRVRPPPPTREGHIFRRCRSNPRVTRGMKIELKSWRKVESRVTAIEDYAGDEFQASLSELSVQFVKSGKQRQTRLKVPRTEGYRSAWTPKWNQTQYIHQFILVSQTKNKTESTHSKIIFLKKSITLLILLFKIFSLSLKYSLAKLFKIQNINCK